ncbi:MAG: radical SAM protein [Elusimicrobia bacterium]|nr:radical SAM protein [Elusimicrobiota bacterium]
MNALTEAFEILSVKDIPEIGKVFLARPPGEASRRFEFVDAVDLGRPRSEKWVVMASTQYGCACACRICDAGNFGYHGNLDAAMILEQIEAAVRLHPEEDPSAVRMFKVHFARMGEPSLNPAVLECLERLAKDGRFPSFLPSISTVAPSCAVARDFFRKLRDIKDRRFSGGRFQLQFSLLSTDTEARNALIPVKKWGFAEIAEYGRAWMRGGDRKITLNFALASGIPLDPTEVERFFPPEAFLVKITPVNPTRRADKNCLTTVWYEPPAHILGLKDDLERRGFKVILNASWPQEVEGRASCGQLAEETLRSEVRFG